MNMLRVEWRTAHSLHSMYELYAYITKKQLARISKEIVGTYLHMQFLKLPPESIKLNPQMFKKKKNSVSQMVASVLLHLLAAILMTHSRGLHCPWAVMRWRPTCWWWCRSNCAGDYKHEPLRCLRDTVGWALIGRKASETILVLGRIAIIPFF